MSVTASTPSEADRAEEVDLDQAKDQAVATGAVVTVRVVAIVRVAVVAASATVSVAAASAGEDPEEVFSLPFKSYTQYKNTEAQRYRGKSSLPLCLLFIFIFSCCFSVSPF